MGYRAPYETTPSSKADRVHYTANALGEPVVVKADGTQVKPGGGEAPTPVQTMGAVTATLFSFEAATPDRAYALRGLVNALDESADESNVYEFVAQFHRDGASTVTVKHGGATLLVNDEEMPTAVLAVDVSGTTCRVRVTGVGGKTIEWDGVFTVQSRP